MTRNEMEPGKSAHPFLMGDADEWPSACTPTNQVKNTPRGKKEPLHRHSDTAFFFFLSFFFLPPLELVFMAEVNREVQTF